MRSFSNDKQTTYRLSLLCLIFHLSTLAAPQLRIHDLYDPNRQEECLTYLALASKLTGPESGSSFGVGSLGRLIPLLRLARVPNDNIVEIEKIIAEAEKSFNPLIRKTIRAMGESENLLRLFLCVLDIECTLADDSDGHYDPILENMEVVDQLGENIASETAGGSYEISGVRRLLEPVLLRFPTQYAEEYRSLAFVGTKYHEIRHFLDMEFFSQWIIANRRLIQRGESADPLYRDNIRILNPGTDEEVILVTKSFFTSFKESRGPAVASAVFQLFLSKEMFDIIHGQLLRNAYDEAIEDGAAVFLASYDIEQGDFFTLGPRLFSEMQATIERSNRPARPRRRAS